MIKKTLQKTIHLVYDTVTDNSIMVEVTPDHIQLINERGKKEFIFKTDNTEEVRDRWRNVAKLIIKACDLL